MRFDEIDWQFLTPDTASHAMQAQGLWVCGPDTLQGTAVRSVPSSPKHRRGSCNDKTVGASTVVVLP